MLSQLDFKIFGLETIKDQYVHDAEFKDVLQNCKEGRTWNKFVVNDGSKLMPREGLMGHFGVKKTEDILATHFFWPKMRRYLITHKCRGSQQLSRVKYSTQSY